MNPCLRFSSTLSHTPWPARGRPGPQPRARPIAGRPLPLAMALVLLLALALLLAGCHGNDGDDGEPAPPSEGQATIGVDGGTVQGPDGVVVSLPAGALAATTTVRIARDSSGAPALDAPMVVLSPIYTVTPHLPLLGQPATVSLAIDASKLDPGGPPPMVMVAEPGGAWEVLGTAPLQGATLRAQTLHFSYVVAVQTPVRFVSAELVLPDALKPPAGTPDLFHLYRSSLPFTASVKLTLSSKAFDNTTGNWYCRTPMSIVMRVSGPDARGVVGPGTTTTLGPFTSAATANFSFSIDGRYSKYAFVELTESCVLTFPTPGSRGVAGAIISTGRVGTFVLSIGAPPGAPVIAFQPSALSVAAGQPASFSVTASASNVLTGRWFRSDDSGASWQDTGVSGTRLDLASAALADDGALFRVNLCNTSGGLQTCIDSAPAQLKVAAAPVPPGVATPPVAVTASIGGSASFSVVASGTAPMSYQWTLNGVALVNRSAGSGSSGIAGADTSTLTLSQVQAADAGLYRVRLSNGTAPDATSDGAALTVLVPPVPTPSALVVVTGSAHSCVLKADGSVACWGANASGQLGDGGTLPRSSPTTVPGLAAEGLAAGAFHSCAVQAGGTVACWGLNSFGALGDGSTAARLSPATVPGLGGVASVVAGSGHSCALMRDGSVVCWGSNQFGQVGDGSTVTRLSPSTVSGLGGITALSSGAYHLCALRNDQRVLCWGDNASGQLGDGSNVSKSLPTLVPGLSHVVALTAGTDHSCAVIEDGSLACWGSGFYGQLGDGSKTSKPNPTPVPGLTGVLAVGAGDFHTCAALTGGDFFCWGYGGLGQLGSGGYLNQSSPDPIGGMADVVQLDGGGGHTCAVKRDNSLWCWGRNLSGQIGDGSTVDRPKPTRVPLP